MSSSSMLTRNLLSNLEYTPASKIVVQEFVANLTQIEPLRAHKAIDSTEDLEILIGTN